MLVGLLTKESTTAEIGRFGLFPCQDRRRRFIVNDEGGSMRSITRAALFGTAALPLAVLAPALASASTAADVSFAYTASG